jgi:cation:H+ antiporter
VLLSFILLIFGVALLYGGGEALIKGSVHLSRSLGLSSMVIGLTVVAFATSSPELAASLTAALRGSPDVAIGNVLGSNVANVGLILGVAALIHPLAVHARFVRREIPFMVGVSLLLYPVFLDRSISRLEGLALFALLSVYLVYLLRGGEAPPVEQELAELTRGETLPLSRSSGLVGIGIVMLVGGAWLVVEGAIEIALTLGVPERVIGLTMVAFGTSLPELASAVAAARKREGDLVLGNVIGSNVFNILCILGLTAMVQPVAVAEAARTGDFWIMVFFGLLTVPFLSPARRLGRLHGAGLVALYVAYVVWLY